MSWHRGTPRARAAVLDSKHAGGAASGRTLFESPARKPLNGLSVLLGSTLLSRTVMGMPCGYG